MRNDAFCGIMPEIAAEKKGSRNPEVPADIVILFVLMNMNYARLEAASVLVVLFVGAVVLIGMYLARKKRNN